MTDAELIATAALAQCEIALYCAQIPDGSSASQGLRVWDVSPAAGEVMDELRRRTEEARVGAPTPEEEK